MRQLFSISCRSKQLNVIILLTGLLFIGQSGHYRLRIVFTHPGSIMQPSAYYSIEATHAWTANHGERLAALC